MRDHLTLRLLLKRGALLSAANWPVVTVQFVASTAFNILLTIPILGGIFLVAVLIGGNATGLLDQGIRAALSEIASTLVARPAALAAFVVAFLIALVGGSIFMFLIKGGTVTVLAAADRVTSDVESGPWRADRVWHASAFSAALFVEGCRRLFTRYLMLGIGLMMAYAVSAALYLAVVVRSYRLVSQTVPLIGWTMMAALISTGFVLWITVVNLVYLLIQIAIAVEDLSVWAGVTRVARFLRAERREIAGVFGIVLAIVVMTTAASLLATAGVSLIAFVPIVGLAVFPLQAAAWLVRSLVFEYLGLTALCAYLHLYRMSGAADRVGPQPFWTSEAGA